MMIRVRCTVLVLRMAHRKWKETKEQPGTAGPGNMLSCCLISFHFMWVILSTSTVLGWSKRWALGCVNDPLRARTRDHATKVLLC